ncbi:hypothetical protein BDV36DRAFT_266161 [Aspergillus pseudocaelatus]|uniref:Uncharacterized protein n=1 Tax=Aspergillus pseudocaelatus TaxID=1825620 RepID=A0ABQ6WAL7_9EURO|nr:hypothetical protein BDV36DRAFT_266161 [Aspergillus pseudocaelatus]
MDAEVFVGGWFVELEVQVRYGGPFESGTISTGFWDGVTLGKFILCFINELLGMINQSM